MDYDFSTNEKFNKYLKDPSLLAYAKGLRDHESGSDSMSGKVNYGAKGDNGHSFGAYQFNKPMEEGSRWSATAKKYTGNAKLPMTPKNQDAIALLALGDDKYELGLTPQQLASKWNSGNPDRYLDTNTKGVNNSQGGYSYDVKKHNDAVMANYQKYAQQVLQQQQSPTAGAPVVTADGRQVPLRTERERIAYERQVAKTGNQNIFDNPMNKIDKSAIPTQGFGNKLRRTGVYIVNGINDVGIGLARGATALGDLALTGVNAATGGELMDNAAYEFGTAARKEKTSRLLRGKNFGQKVGRTVFDLGVGAVSGNAVAPLGNAIRGSQAVGALANTGRVGSTAARLLPGTVENIAQGVAMNAAQGQDITPGTVAFDAGGFWVLDGLGNVAARSGILGKGLKNSMYKKAEDSLFKSASTDPRARQALEKDLANMEANWNAPETVTEIRKLDNFDQTAARAAKYSGETTPTSIFKFFAEYIPENIQKTLIGANGEFDPAQIKTYIEKEVVPGHYKRITQVAKSLDSVTPVNTDELIALAPNEVANITSLKYSKGDSLKRIQSFLRTRLGSNPSFSEIVNILAQPNSSLAGGTIKPEEVKALKNILEDYLYSKVKGTRNEEFFRKSFAEIHKASAAKLLFQAKNNKNIPGMPSAYLTKMVGMMFGSGMTFNPVGAAVGAAASDTLRAKAARVFGTAKFAQQAKMKVAKKLGILKDPKAELQALADGLTVGNPNKYTGKLLLPEGNPADVNLSEVNNAPIKSGRAIPMGQGTSGFMGDTQPTVRPRRSSDKNIVAKKRRFQDKVRKSAEKVIDVKAEEVRPKKVKTRVFKSKQ